MLEKMDLHLFIITVNLHCKTTFFITAVLQKCVIFFFLTTIDLCFFVGVLDRQPTKGSTRSR
jgi:hypothetical protein